MSSNLNRITVSIMQTNVSPRGFNRRINMLLI